MKKADAVGKRVHIKGRSLIGSFHVPDRTSTGNRIGRSIRVIGVAYAAADQGCHCDAEAPCIVRLERMNPSASAMASSSK